MRVSSNIPNIGPAPARGARTVTRAAGAPDAGSASRELIVGSTIAVIVTSGLVLLAVAVNVMVMDGPAVPPQLPLLAIGAYLAGVLFLASFPLAFLLGRSDDGLLARHCAYWDRSGRAAFGPMLTAVLVVASIMWFDVEADVQVHPKLQQRNTVQLVAARDLPATLVNGQERFFEAHGRYATSSELRATAPVTAIRGALLNVRAVAVMNGGRTWLAQLDDGRQVSQTYGHEPEFAPAGSGFLQAGAS